MRRTLLVVAGIALLLAGVETLTASAGLGIGRRLEVGLRRALDATVPRLPDRYLRSRPPSDMAQRAHALHELRLLPLLASQLLAAVLETVLVATALCVLDPAGAPYVVLATIGALGVALLVQLPLRERELRAREHASALSQSTLDAVLGVLAIRAHGAEPALTGEHDVRLRGWVGAARAAVRARTTATLPADRVRDRARDPARRRRARAPRLAARAPAARPVGDLDPARRRARRPARAAVAAAAHARGAAGRAARRAGRGRRGCRAVGRAAPRRRRARSPSRA